MTINECYEKLGGDYAQMERRIPNAALIKKFITKFLDNTEYGELCSAMAEGKRQEAFAAAHTLKGVSANLSLDRLTNSVSKLTELLRTQNDTMPIGADVLFEEVKQDYEHTTKTIRDFLESC